MCDVVTKLAEIATIRCKQQGVRTVRYNTDGFYCLTCGADKKIKLWNPTNQLLLKTYGGHANYVLDVASSCDNSQLVSGSSDKSVILWDVISGNPLRRYRSHTGSVTCVKYNEQSTIAVSGSVDNTVCFWDILSRKQDPVQILKDAKDTVTSVQVTDYEILTTSVDSHVRLYDIRVAKMISDYISKIITFGSITHDEQCYVISCADSTIRLFDKSSGEILNTYSGHESQDYSLENTVNDTDTCIISGSASGDIFYWDLITGECIKKLKHSDKPVLSITHHPTKNYLISACEDEIKVWGIPNTDD